MNDANIEPPKPVKPCQQVKNLRRGVEHYRQHWHRSLAPAVSAAESALADAWSKDQATHTENAEAIAHNTAMRARITAMMKAAGVPDSYTAPDPKSRHWPQKHKRYDAGYLGDIHRTFPISDDFEQARRYHDEQAKLIAEAKVKVEGEKAELERQAEAEKAKRRADLALVAIILRYQLPEDSDWTEVLEALCKRDKYLDLAVAGIQTRGDWSEGFWRVEAALKRFKIDDDRDKDIAADLCGCLAGDDEDRDGRIFRDTEWSYDKLFGLVVDQQLLTDARTAMEHVQ